MTTTVTRTHFGQKIPASDQLDVAARSIVCAIGDGIPAAWAGFVWYRPGYELVATADRRDEQVSETSEVAA